MVILFSIALGLIIMAVFPGKKSAALKSIAVSGDEQYIACYEWTELLGKNNHKARILCFRSDGSLAFEFDILPEFSAGGACTLWFENDMLCILFYRTDIIVHYAMNGVMIDTVDDTTEEYPSKFPAFDRAGPKYVFDGNKIDVVYDHGSFWGYMFCGTERKLTITTEKGEAQVVWAETAD